MSCVHIFLCGIFCFDFFFSEKLCVCFFFVFNLAMCLVYGNSFINYRVLLGFFFRVCILFFYNMFNFMPYTTFDILEKLYRMINIQCQKRAFKILYSCIFFLSIREFTFVFIWQFEHIFLRDLMGKSNLVVGLV